jgi:hypothetical protein
VLVLVLVDHIVPPSVVAIGLYGVERRPARQSASISAMIAVGMMLPPPLLVVIVPP